MVGPRRRKDTCPVTAFGLRLKGKIRLVPLFPGRRPVAAALFVAALGSGPARRRARPCALLRSSKAASWPLRPGLAHPCVWAYPAVTGAEPPHPHSVRIATRPAPLPPRQSSSFRRLYGNPQWGEVRSIAALAPLTPRIRGTRAESGTKRIV
jgi:hypothetical protein